MTIDKSPLVFYIDCTAHNNTKDTKTMTKATKTLADYFLDLQADLDADYLSGAEIEKDLEDIDDIRDTVEQELEDEETTQEEATAILAELAEAEKPYKEFRELSNLGDIQFIHERVFTEHVTEMLEDCGHIPKDFPSWIVIDWEATAGNVKQDYSTIGEYYYRD